MLNARFLVSALVVLGLAGALTVQALGMASTRRAPAQSVSILPSNAPAHARLAYKSFADAAADGASETQAATAAAPIALRAISTDPLLPRAHAVLAASLDPSQRSAFLSSASALHRRNLSLQGQVLQEALQANDPDVVIETLDQILRVNPEYEEEFFGVLIGAMRDERSVPAFARILDGSTGWHARFLFEAAGDVPSLDNLLQLRARLSIRSERFDRRLIERFGRTGRIAQAEEAYALLPAQPTQDEEPGLIDWDAQYWPFEWEFADTAGFRAQSSRDGTQLELFARPGQGGVAAQRLVRAPKAPFRLAISYDVIDLRREDIEVTLTCPQTSTPLAQATLAGIGSGLTVARLPEGCEYVSIRVRVSVRNARSTLTGTIDQMELAPVTHSASN